MGRDNTYLKKTQHYQENSEEKIKVENPELSTNLGPSST